MSTHVTRRQFLGTSGKTAAGVAAGLTVNTMLRDARAGQASERFTVALIGCGGMGHGKLYNFIGTKQCDVAAICDVDDSQLAKTAQMVQQTLQQQPKQFKDYRKLLEMKEIDIVIVGTPDHWHAAPTMEAVAADKHVYCEKPCCHNIREGRAMIEAVKKHKKLVQVGTHQRSAKHFQEVRDFIRAGKLGQVSMTQTYVFGNEAPDGMGNAPDTDAPAGVDYDRWLGPAPKRPYNRRRFHHSWRWYFDYAAGMVGDWNVHLQDIIMWSMESPHPVSVSTAGGKLVLTDDRDTPDTMQAVYEFPGYVHTFTMRKASGPPWDKPWGHGMEFHGTNGRLRVNRHGWEVMGDEKDWKADHELRTKSFQKKGRTPHKAHVIHFLECIRENKRPNASIELHYPTVVACHLANISLRVGRKIFWDYKKELCFQDRELKMPDTEANVLLEREYRKGYELPKV